MDMQNWKHQVIAFCVIAYNLAQGAAVCQYYKFFRRFGGIHGTNMSPDMTPLKNIGAGIGNAANQAVDSKRFHTNKSEDAAVAANKE
jgi:hypothetical protein